MGAPVMQWQFVSSKPDQVANFYKALFGWTITAKNAMGYRQVETGAGGMGGGIWPAPPEAHGFVQLFIGVPDVEKAVTQAVALGAQVVVPATTLPDGDTMAVLRDPTGMTFGLCVARPSSPWTGHGAPSPRATDSRGMTACQEGSCLP